MPRATGLIGGGRLPTLPSAVPLVIRHCDELGCGAGLLGFRVRLIQVADDVGCYVQKVAKFGEKLEREHVIGRDRPADSSRHIYFDIDG